MSTTIYDAILAEVERGTFTPDALKKMQAALDKVKGLEETVSVLRDANKDLKSSLDGWAKRENELDRMAADATDKLVAVAAREAKVADALQRIAVAEAKADVRKEVFDTIFKNVTMRSRVTASVPIAQEGANGCAGWVSNFPKTEEIEETQE